MKAGLKPGDVRAMVPRDLVLFVEGWNEAQGGGGTAPDAMTADEYRDLVKRYG